MDDAAIEKALGEVRSIKRAGDIAGAERLCRQLTLQHPRHAMAHGLLGHLLRHLGRDDEALRELTIAIEHEPGLAAAWNEIAIVTLNAGDLSGSEAAARRLCLLSPNDPWSWFTLGHVLSVASSYPEAEKAFERARNMPGAIEARISLVGDAIARKHAEGAIKHGEAATRLAPDNADAWAALGEALAYAEQHDRAVNVLRTACRLAPRDPRLLKRLATMFGILRRGGDELVDIRSRILALEPDSIEALESLGLALISAQRDAEAVSALRRLRKVAPGNLLSRWIEFHVPEQPGFRSIEERVTWFANWQSGLGEFETLDPHTSGLAEQARKILGSSPNFNLAYLGEVDVDLHRRHARVVRKLLDAACNHRLVDVAPRFIGQRRRRIGIVSGCLRKHSVSRAWGEALLALPRADFEVHVFYTSTVEDAMVQRFRDRADNFHAGMANFATWTQRLREAQLDIAIFLDLGLDVINQSLAAVRHAPVQIATWAHPVTTGADSIDYFLSAEATEPADARFHYTETLHCLPNLGGCFATPEPVATAASGNPRNPHLMCVQNLVKLQPEHDALFARIAASVPASRFSFLTAATPRQADVFKKRLYAELQRHAVDSSRVRVLPLLDAAQYRYEIACADVLLDTIGFSGGMTTLDALWCDKPVLTLPGALMRGRQTYAMLKRIGLTDLIASDNDDYVLRAIALARDDEYRAAIGRQIGERKRELFEDRTVCTALADLLRTIEAPDMNTSV
ncbi:MAG: tetratricopeptide repeat protein [Rudaea sp.]|nr:tetratricopeptide repeat protein [Rudaea sp.]